MPLSTYKASVDGMTCEHCVRAIQKAVGGINGVSNVVVNLQDKTVLVSFDSGETSNETIKQTIEEQGFDVE